MILQLITVKAPCPRLEEALKQAYLDEATSSSAKMAKYYEELTEHTGQNISTITDVEFLYNTLEIEEQHNLQLPQWTRKFYNNEMRKIAARSLAIFTNSTIQRRLLGGTMVPLYDKYRFRCFMRFLNCITEEYDIVYRYEIL